MVEFRSGPVGHEDITGEYTALDVHDAATGEFKSPAIVFFDEAIKLEATTPGTEATPTKANDDSIETAKRYSNLRRYFFDLYANPASPVVLSILALLPESSAKEIIDSDLDIEALRSLEMKNAEQLREISAAISRFSDSEKQMFAEMVRNSNVQKLFGFARAAWDNNENFLRTLFDKIQRTTDIQKAEQSAVNIKDQTNGNIKEIVGMDKNESSSQNQPNLAYQIADILSIYSGLAAATPSTFQTYRDKTYDNAMRWREVADNLASQGSNPATVLAIICDMMHEQLQEQLGTMSAYKMLAEDAKRIGDECRDKDLSDPECLEKLKPLLQAAAQVAVSASLQARQLLTPALLEMAHSSGLTNLSTHRFNMDNDLDLNNVVQDYPQLQTLRKVLAKDLTRTDELLKKAAADFDQLREALAKAQRNNLAALLTQEFSKLPNKLPYEPPKQISLEKIDGFYISGLPNKVLIYELRSYLEKLTALLPKDSLNVKETTNRLLGTLSDLSNLLLQLEAAFTFKETLLKTIRNILFLEAKYRQTTGYLFKTVPTTKVIAAETSTSRNTTQTSPPKRLNP